MKTEAGTESANKLEPALKLNFYSHATLDCHDVELTRRFYQEFLGLEAVMMGDGALAARLGGDQIIVIVQNPNRKGSMHLFNHNGLDVGTEAEVDNAYAVVKRDAEKWGLKKITRPLFQHGTYSFYFWDMDDNAWEILANPKGGFAWVFERGEQEVAAQMTSVGRPVS
ncbi:glyoxalase/bleomycin resistance protein/dioxygenase [Cystobacter fuscus]|uniref:Glyoxalase/bleomycin resistance protein/dioxygenase n=1 Tax=Cystobacter fuscus TaxID=43 RepID=A0A250J9J2_9BACT|nr:VOC family protein [Cystobacter fuscus]ATB40177.1 glyoxalase/bleomycin resistance protein/dioxygenase [Cystobacter fuscus]